MSRECEKNPELIVAYLDGELMGADRERLEAHLASCSHCSGLLEQYRHAVEATRELEQPQAATEGFSEKFWQKFESRREPRIGRILKAVPAWPMLAGAAAAAAAVVLYLVISAPRPTSEDYLIVRDLELFADYEVISNLEILEDLDFIEALDEGV